MIGYLKILMSINTLSIKANNLPYQKTQNVPPFSYEGSLKSTSSDSSHASIFDYSYWRRFAFYCVQNYYTKAAWPYESIKFNKRKITNQQTSCDVKTSDK